MAQKASIFKQYNEQDGLPSNYVFSIVEDYQNYLWAGTDKGLAKYDGFSWKLFTKDDGLPGNYIKELYPVAENKFWLFIATKGICYYDVKNKKNTVLLNNYTIFRTKTLDDGSIIILCAENTNGAENIIYQIQKKDPTKLIEIIRYKNIVNTKINLKEATQKKIYYAANDKSDIISTPAAEWQYFENTDTIGNYNVAFHLTKDITLGLKNIIFHELGKNISVPILSNVTGYAINAIPYKEAVWVTNERDGIFVITKNGIQEHYSFENKLPTNNISSIYKTKSGELLISALGHGILSTNKIGNVNIPIDNLSTRGIVSNEQFVYLLKDKEVIKINPTTQEVVARMVHTETNLQSLNFIDNLFFINTLTGTAVYKETNSRLNKIKFLKETAGVSNTTKFNNQYLLSTYGSSVRYYNNNFEPQAVKKTVMDVIEKTFTIKEGAAHINYEDGLQLQYANANYVFTKKEGLPANTAYHVHEHQDTLWISTSAGVAAIYNFKVVKTITTGIVGSKCIYTFHDVNNKLWLVSDKQLHEYTNGSFNVLKNTFIKDNPNDIVKYSLYDNSSNSLISVVNNSIIFSNLKSNAAELSRDSVSINAITIDGTSFANSSSIKVPSDFASLQIQFNPINLNPFGSSNIYYKLEGLNNDFVMLTDSLTVNFNKLRSGAYSLYVKSIDANGNETNPQLITTLNVAPKFWQTNTFYGLSGVALASIAFVAFAYRNKNRRKIAERQQLLNQKISNERDRISRDLHDHLGSSILTMIAQTDNIESKLRNSKITDAVEKLQELSEQSRDTMNVLRETIWAVQEEQHTIKSFVARINIFLQRILPQKNITWIIENNIPEQTILTPNQTLQLFRIIQECTQNIVKHAEASKVHYNFKTKQQVIALIITDNGKGLATNNVLQGNGLLNIADRVKSLNGTFTYKNGEPNGLESFISFPILKLDNHE